MARVPEVDVQAARDWLTSKEAVFLDIRDPGSHAAGRIPASRRLHDGVVESFLEETPRDSKIVVYCYHGNSSLMAAAWLLEQGFSTVYSLAGGFEAWHRSHADCIETQ
ncbi:MAG TPA: thiosulfate sulfurtransferase GlpE [Planctomycetes bacterium]|nr:thiosulfate sulfurtransferase GlpE [Planctomycetota bacterium]